MKEVYKICMGQSQPCSQKTGVGGGNQGHAILGGGRVKLPEQLELKFPHGAN